MIVLNNIDELPTGCADCPYVYWPLDEDEDSEVFCGVSRENLVVGFSDWMETSRPISCPLVEVNDSVRMNAPLFDKEETFHNCTVQVLTNTVTGDTSVGWWPEGQNLNI